MRALLICGLLLVNKLGNPGTALFFGILAVMIVRSSSAAFLALLLAGLGLATNNAIVPKNVFWTVARLAILFVCLARFTFDLAHSRRSLVGQPYFIALMLFLAAATVCSVVSGYFVQIALLKLVSFGVGISAMFAAVEVLRERRVDLTGWFVAIAAAIVMNGLLMLATGGGYGVKGDGTPGLFFMGPFLHPNACGPYCALVTVLLFSTWLFTPHRGRWICLALLLPVLYFVWLSKSRTGGLSMVAGLFFVFVLTYMPATRRFIRSRLTMSRSSLVAAGIVLALALVVVDLATRGTLVGAVRGFLFKYKMDVENSSILNTRWGSVELMWRHFLERPIFGMGFQVSLDPYFIANATIWSAPIEKGVLYMAVLEEVGVVGAIPFALFLLTLMASLWRRRNAIGLAMLLTYLFTNLGECTFFAMGGWAVLSWMLVAAGILIGEQCLVPRQPPLLRPVMR